MEERNLKISLEKAKKLYKEGSEEIKLLLLQTFSKEELEKENFPKTWEEFCKRHPKVSVEFYTDLTSNIHEYSNSNRWYKSDKNLYKTEELAEASLAMAQLLQLRDAYRQGWKPDWSTESVKYTITIRNNDFLIENFWYTRGVFAFQSKEIAKEFLENFKDLLEKIKPLYN